MSKSAPVASPAARSLSNDAVDSSELAKFFARIRSRITRGQTGLDRGALRLTAGRAELERFFTAVSRQVDLAQARQRRIDKRRATGFNVFDLIEPDENKFSDILALLADSNGGHGQGDLFLRLLFSQLGLRADPKLTKNVTVQREAPTHGIQKYRRRMDVFIEAETLVAIENKVDALDQTEQVKDYLEHLRYCTRGSRKRSVLIYLTPNGRRPASLEGAALDEAEADGCLCCWSYHVHLRKWLENCARACAAPRIQQFLCDLIGYIDVHLQREPVAEEEEEEAADEN